MAEVNDDLLDRLRDAFYRAGRVAATDDLRNRLAAAGSDLAVALRSAGLPDEVHAPPTASPAPTAAVSPAPVTASPKILYAPNVEPVESRKQVALSEGLPVLKKSSESEEYSESSEAKEDESPPSNFPLVLGAGLMLLFIAIQGSMLTDRGPAQPISSSIDNADTAWMMVSTAFVMVMVPALGLFEAGLLRAKNSVSVLMQCFAGLIILSAIWYLIGFSLCFGEDAGLYGSLQFTMMNGVGAASPLPMAPTIPGMLYVAFQGKFACIAPLLVTGAFAERLKFEGFVLFIVGWSFVVYFPLCHWIWGGGFLGELGVVDFAGGLVLHTSAGVASLVSCVMLGPRIGFANEHGHDVLVPHNLPMAATGAGLLWLGWFGFNGGSALTSGALAANTLVVSHVAASTSACVWLFLDWTLVGRPTFVGVINGAISGLAGVTPASGYVLVQSSFSIGLIVGASSYGGIYLFKDRLRIDDALDVSSVHGVTGVVGSLLIGIYATTEANPDGPDGILAGGGLDSLVAQTIGVAVSAAWAAIGTWLVMKAIGIGLGSARITREDEKHGIDKVSHREQSYLNLHTLI